jgi:hypothetical protein
MRTVLMTAAALVSMAALGKWLRVPPEPDTVLPIRDAGPECMSDPPDAWDMTDETSDESFPASDPPGGY